MTVEKRSEKGLNGFVVYEIVRCGWDIHYFYQEYFSNFYKAKDYLDALRVLGGRRFVLVEYK
jgi:hypothetical protein